jgi:hypothetical protein
MLLIENLPPDCDLNSLTALVDGVPATGCYLGPAENGLSLFDVFLPEGVRTGLVPLRLEFRGQRLCPDATLRVISPGPSVPHLISVSDGVNLISHCRIESDSLKATIGEVDSIDDLTATVGGMTVEEIETFPIDPLARRYEVNLRLPPGVGRGTHLLQIHLAHRLLTRIEIEIV